MKQDYSGLFGCLGTAIPLVFICGYLLLLCALIIAIIYALYALATYLLK